ncbi:MAG: hypothetical protein FWH03_05530 [Firmicutes bacterium]|nr:hypothetical protein [Bacillota bacterium]
MKPERSRADYIVSCLITVPSTDCNFKGALNEATIEDINKALKDERCTGKTKRQTLEARLRKLQKGTIGPDGKAIPRTQNNKPKAKLTGEDGNVFNLMGICIKALEGAGAPEKAKEMQDRITSLKPDGSNITGYDRALQIMMEYCDVE